MNSHLNDRCRKKREEREVEWVRDRSLCRRSFNLYHCILSDSRNSRTKFISHRVTERGRLFTVIVRCALKFNNECVLDLIETFVCRVIHYLATLICRLKILLMQRYKHRAHQLAVIAFSRRYTYFISHYKSVEKIMICIFILF